MDDLQTSFNRYRAEAEKLRSAAESISELLKGISQSAGVLSTVDARAKDVSSFVKKAMTKPGYRDDAWNKTTDKVGARVITDTLSDRERVLNAILDSNVSILKVENKRDLAKPSELFYPGVHLQVVIPDFVFSNGDQIECEVQLRTKAEDLWSVPSHKLIYKGVVTPAKETVRRVWRLSALTEIFDEEVERAMNEVLAFPEYDQAHLLSIAESFYLIFVPSLGDRDLSLEVLLEISGVFPQRAQFDHFREQITDFVKTHSARITSIYKQYGETSEFASISKYWLFTQPESILIFEAIENRPMLMRDVAVVSNFEYAFEPLFEVWGVPFATPTSN